MAAQEGADERRCLGDGFCRHGHGQGVALPQGKDGRADVADTVDQQRHIARRHGDLLKRQGVRGFQGHQVVETALEPLAQKSRFGGSIYRCFVEHAPRCADDPVQAVLFDTDLLGADLQVLANAPGAAAGDFELTNVGACLADLDLETHSGFDIGAGQTAQHALMTDQGVDVEPRQACHQRLYARRHLADRHLGQTVFW